MLKIAGFEKAIRRFTLKKSSFFPAKASILSKKI